MKTIEVIDFDNLETFILTTKNKDLSKNSSLFKLAIMNNHIGIIRYIVKQGMMVTKESLELSISEKVTSYLENQILKQKLLAVESL